MYVRGDWEAGSIYDGEMMCDMMWAHKFTKTSAKHGTYAHLLVPQTFWLP